VILDNSQDLPDGTRVKLVVVETAAAPTTLGQRLMELLRPTFVKTL
jgi:hypothetical protein